MASKTTKAPVIPWPREGITNRTQAYTDKDLRALAVRAARREGGRLIDWRILLPGDRPNVSLQTRVLMPDGTVRYHNTAI